ncbi:MULTISPECIES: DUF4062 domain-containing protein [unclassified Agarivorans]|uniref:DUF4062 domain-containing protein n=1 Tax=unclassified Agarivorans TaxID=2636026 RepID=UPI0026E1FE43|nr:MULTISPECIES: DUF4062 domain-containing protein [unclassified Agarivorans]MDO6685891.1 DUF4062 domain-containing protein [Agarivorans sp. 3_MG-2023]MDO6713971.1 DUF4062 domain-containing protein [Agarivorans sp. 2_MG-2023]
MAAPRVFISSTCFDLAEVRDSLTSFCEGFGFEVVMSDRGDVFYHPDLHTHESCINEISNCQLFILIIGGRFGGRYKIEQSKSITNAEYVAAKEKDIPIFSFVKEDVLADHHVYQKNKGKRHSKNIEYPSMEKQEYAENIFDFIDTVRSPSKNNGFFGFKFARDLHDSLRKQWSGMFFDFLSQRNVSNQLKTTNESVSNLSIASKKIEELIKGIYRQVDSVGANDSISIIDSESEATKFFEFLSSAAGSSNFIDNSLADSLAIESPPNWWEFAVQIDGFTIERFLDARNRKIKALMFDRGVRGVATVVCYLDGSLNSREVRLKDKFELSYEHYLKLSKASKLKILREYDEIPF